MAESADASSRDDSTPGRAFFLSLAALVCAHLALLLHFAPLRVLLGREPVSTVDYALHVYQVDRARIAFAEHGALWSYDPFVLAGQPAGVVEDLTSKGTELFVIGLSALGVPWGLAFNLFILLVHLAMPLSAWLVGALLRLTRWQTLVLHGLWVWLWFFDSFMHWSWWIGMITWSFASYAIVVFVALLWRALSDQKLRHLAWLCVLTPVLAIVHPFAGITLLPVCLALVVVHARQLHWRSMLWLGAAVALGAATALVWAPVTSRFGHYVGDVDTFFNATLSFIVYDSFDLLKDGRQTGGPMRTAVRTLCFIAAAIGLLRWKRQKDPRFFPLAWLVGACLVLAYGSAYFWLGRQTQPYRHIGPGMYAAAVPAAVLLWQVLSPRAVRGYPPGAQLALLFVSLLAIPRLVRTVLHYVPELLPTQVERSNFDLLSSPLVGLNEPKPVTMRHHGGLPEQEAVRDFLRAAHQGRGRVVTNDWVLGEYLVVAANVPVLGGITERNVPHVDAHLFRREKEGNIGQQALRDYFRDYAVGFVILGGDHGPVDARRDLLEPVKNVMGYRVYRTREEPSYFAQGAGRVREQRVNHIFLQDVTGPSVVLRFHFMESLACRPDCKIERAEIPGDRVGFIRVDRPPTSFEIYNAY
ncbi:MAG TPA: hypothetical protein PKA88_06140 [Polyangiaceae bacterium]|nr:hypothetical protein [Polyangiaceae bacterium]